MSETLPILEGKQDNFSMLVIENSYKGPVCVYYWAEKAAPCHKFFPVLTQLVKDFQGRFLLVTVNTDAQSALCHQQKITSVPTLHLFYQGQKVKQWHGPQSAGDLHAILAEYLTRKSDQTIIDALNAYKAGDVEQALSMLAKAALDDPENLRIPVTLSKLLMAQGRHTEALNLLEALPDDIKKQKDVLILLAHQRFIQIAKNAPDKSYLAEKSQHTELTAEEHYQYAALCLLDDEYDLALKALFTILKANKSEDIQQGMLAIFDILGEDHALVLKYRPALFNILY